MHEGKLIIQQNFKKIYTLIPKLTYLSKNLTSTLFPNPSYQNIKQTKKLCFDIKLKIKKCKILANQKRPLKCSKRVLCNIKIAKSKQTIVIL